MDTRALILAQATELLATSPSGEITTRAVCDAAGVTQPVLYRLFGDKDGLLAAVADDVWAEYLAMKRSAEPTPDPLDDLRTGWDNHTAFALAHPHAYRLVFASGLTTRPAATGEAMRLLEGITQRLAEAGRLRVSPSEAARIVMAANSGLALGLILRPEVYPDAGISEVTRDVVIGSILSGGVPADDAVATAATTLTAHLRSATSPTTGFTPAERDLLDEWLRRLA